MAHQSDLITQDIQAYLEAHQHKSLLRFITCGSVDDGKSSLIGRLLYESQMLFEDQLAALESDSRKVGTRGGELDYALLLDGLAAEREQGITIDVAYRFFSTDRRKFIVADTPGHEQYTRNMVTGASTADVAIILIDARKGMLTQTRRHSTLVALLGIRQVVLAINKMDLVDYDESRFRTIAEEYRGFARQIGIEQVQAIPLSAIQGDNVIAPQGNTPWYDGPSLMPWLETVPLDETRTQAGAFRLPVQWVNRPDLDFRGFSGTIVAGEIRPGMRIRTLPSGRTSTVARIVTYGGDLQRAVAQQAVTLTLTDEIDISRGDLICLDESPADVSAHFTTTLVWMADAALIPGRAYLMKIGARTITAQVSNIRYRLNVDTLEHLPADSLALNEIGVCDLDTDRPIAFDPYEDNRDTGGFILIDRLTNGTVGAGMLRGGREAPNRNVSGRVDAGSRAAALGQQPTVLWLYGLSGSGKSSIAAALELALQGEGYRTMLLDGDRLRSGLSRDLGFDAAARSENLRRAAYCAQQLADAGLVVIATFITPLEEDRRRIRDIVAPHPLLEVFIDTPLALCEARDPKGLYARARRGEIKLISGIDAPFEAPQHAHLRIDGAQQDVPGAVEQIAHLLREREHRRPG
jgi:bifunctional enzyme CysN/CysC